MNIRFEKKPSGTMNMKLIFAVILVVAIVMVAAYFVGAQFRPDDDASDSSDTVLDDGSGDSDDGADTVTDSDVNTDDQPGADGDGDTDDTVDSGGVEDDSPDDTDGVGVDTETDTDAPETFVCEDHIWAEASCDEPMTCTLCGVTEGEPTAHAWREATCNTPQYCSLCGTIGGPELEHTWSDADCLTAKTCSACGEVEGAALGHDYASATCTKARECVRCKDTKGEALGHAWKNIGCDSPMKCTVCGAANGAVPGHKWADATCTKAKTCSVCGKKSGSANGHSFKDGFCSACGDADPNAPAPDSDVKTLYIDSKEVAVKVIYIDGVAYVPVVAFSKAIDSSELKTTDDGSKATVKGKGITISAGKGNPYIEANNRCLPCDDIKVKSGAVYAPIGVMTKIFGSTVKTLGNEVFVTAKGSYIKNGDDFYDAETLSLIARVLTCEAGYESFDGLLAVGSLILNRVESSEFPDTVYAVLYQKNQFTVVNTNAFKEDPSARCVRAAKMCLEGYRYDKRILFYDSLGSGTWASKNRPFLFKLGNHYFYG